MADEQVKIGIVAEDKTGLGVSSVKRNLQGLGQTAQQAAGGLNNLKAVALGAGGAFAGMGLVAAASGLRNMAGAALQSYASYERLSQSINAMAAKEALLTGAASNMAQALSMTKEQSKETLDWISKLAIESPFKQADVAQAFRLAQALGFNTSEAKRLTAATLDWATATGAQGYDIERVNRALGQMKVKGKVSQEEINQLTEAGVDAGRILSDAFGMSGKDLEKAFQSGRITAGQAIEAIIADMEHLYQGAGKESANSMTGLLSTLEEIQDITGRNLLGGMFQAAQPYLTELTGILNSPEVQGGITAFGAGLGAGLTGMLDGAAASAEKVSDAIEPLLNAGAPAWMVTLQAIAAATGSAFKITITPEITKIKLPSVDPNNPDGGGTVNLTANLTKFIWPDGSYIAIDTKARSLTLLPGVGLPPLEITLTPGQGKKLAELGEAWNKGIFDGTNLVTGPGAGLGAELGKQTRVALQAEFAKVWTSTVNITANWGDTWTQVYSAVAKIIPDLSMFPDWFKNAMGGLGLGGPMTPANANGGISIGGTGRQRAAPTQAVRDKSQDKPGLLTPVGTYPGQRYWGRAIGDGFHRGGMAWVGEQGPEAVWLPRGTEIMTNRDSRAAFGLPHYAEGTDGARAFGNSLWGFLRIFGIQRQSETMGPPTRAEWNKTFHDIAVAGVKAAEQTGNAFEEAAQDTAKAFAGTLESALGNVPGLFGTSQVTDQQMKLAAAGVPQNFADDYLRQLSDEVLNGKDWGDKVDIKDAAKRAGIDPNLPNEIVLDLVKEAWSNQSFFANAANLDLINTDAVKASLEQQQKEAQGKANIMSMFGLTDESSQQTADQLGAALNSVFGKAAESDALAGSGGAIFNKLIGGMSDPATAATGMGQVASSMAAASALPENAAILYDAGKSDARVYYDGWRNFASTVPPSPPSAPPLAGPPPATGTTPPGRAIGTGFWQGGYMTVHADETIYAPRGTRVDRAGEMSMAAAPIVNYVTINQQIDEEAFLAKMARRLRAGR